MSSELKIGYNDSLSYGGSSKFGIASNYKMGGGMIREANRANLEWKDICFYTPTAKDAEEREENPITGSVVHGIMDYRKQDTKKKFK